MNVDNLFRFVAIRRPRQHDPATETTLVFAATAFIRPNRSEVSDRFAAASAVLDSAQYVLRNPRWKPFLAAEDRARRLLADARAGSADLRTDAEQLIASVTQPSQGLASFVGSELYRHLRESLWHSYFGNVILLSRRGRDRERLTFWIRFLHLLAELAEGRTPSAVQVDGWRIAIPAELIQAEPARQPAPPRPLPAHLTLRRQQTAAARRKVEELTIAVEHLEQLVKRRVHAAIAAQSVQGRAAVPGTPVAPVISVVKAPTAAVPVIISRSRDEGADDSPEASWQLRPEEVDPSVLETLGRHDISFIAHDLIEISGRLEHQLAVAASDLFALEHVSEIAVVRGMPVRRRRRLSEAELTEGQP